MSLRHITMIIMGVVAVGLAAYDVIPFLNPERGDTISEIMLYIALRSLTIPMVCGVLSGHFFFPQDNGSQYPKILLSILLSFIAVDVVTHVFSISPLMRLQEMPGITFLASIPIGSYLWTQNKSDKL